jgi:hypothetical protein
MNRRTSSLVLIFCHAVRVRNDIAADAHTQGRGRGNHRDEELACCGRRRHPQRLARQGHSDGSEVGRRDRRAVGPGLRPIRTGVRAAGGGGRPKTTSTAVRAKLLN